jgi:hypothetical protein
MAKRPAVLPNWAAASYGGYGATWEKALAQCRDVVYAWAAAREYKF